MKVLGGIVGLAAVLVATPGWGKPAALPDGARYVAMGSSFAAGPGVGPNTPDSPQRCGRGTLNYPNLLAERLKLKLVDATCSGAKTVHVWPMERSAPQIDSVDGDTRLVTITIGGNDGAGCQRGSGGGSEGLQTFKTPCHLRKNAVEQWHNRASP